MRTTVDLPDELVRAARVRAAEGDETLKDLFTRALAHELGNSATKKRGVPPLISSKRRSSVEVSAEDLEEALVHDDISHLP